MGILSVLPASPFHVVMKGRFASDGACVAELVSISFVGDCRGACPLQPQRVSSSKLHPSRLCSVFIKLYRFILPAKVVKKRTYNLFRTIAPLV